MPQWLDLWRWRRARRRRERRWRALCNQADERAAWLRLCEEKLHEFDALDRMRPNALTLLTSPAPWRPGMRHWLFLGVGSPDTWGKDELRYVQDCIDHTRADLQRDRILDARLATEK